MQRIGELDGLRAIAILAVFICHFARQYHGLSFLRLGWAGVDLFFAISGFLITGILMNMRHQESPYLTFYWRRALRIFPPYYLALTLILLLILVHNERLPYREFVRCGVFLSSAKLGLIKSAFSRLFFHGPSGFAGWNLGGYYYAPEFKNSLAVYWSLSVEELFYLIWGPVILKGSRNMIFAWSILPLLMCPILRGIVHTPNYQESYGVIFRFDSLTAGGCAALLVRAVNDGHIAARFLDRALLMVATCSFAGLGLMAWHYGAFREEEIRSSIIFSTIGFSVLAIFCASLVALCVRSRLRPSIFSDLLKSRAAVYLGTVSYTMYLIHMPVYTCLQLAVLRFVRENNTRVLDTNNWILLLLGVLASICTVAVAHFSWVYIEAPILQLKDRRFPISGRQRSIECAVEAAAP